MMSTRRAAARRGGLVLSLSDDIALHVLSFLDVQVLWSVLQSNKRFMRLASEDILWHKLLAAELGEDNLPPSSASPGSWRKRFWQWQRLDACGYDEQQTQPSAESPEVRGCQQGWVLRVLRRCGFCSQRAWRDPGRRGEGEEQTGRGG